MIRKKPIFFKNEIMKVNIAAQTLSSSVANALDFCRDDLQLDQFKDSAATSQFCRNIDASFDILNSRNRYNKNQQNMLLRVKICNRKKKVNELVKSFSSLTLAGRPISETKQHTGFLGLIIGLRNVISIAE